MSFIELFKANLKIVYRDVGGLFWTIVLPLVVYVVLALLPINKFLNISFDYSRFILPGIIAYVLMQGGIYGLGYWMVDMRAQGVVKRFLATPMKEWQLALAVVCSRLAVMLVQVLLLTLVSIFVFHVPFLWNVLSITAFTLIGGAIFLMFGLLISTMAGSYQAAAPITAVVGLPMTFLGNMFFPVYVLPHSVQVLAKILPVTYLAGGLRTVYTEPFAWYLVQTDFIVLLAWLVFMLLLTVWRFKLEE